ncbi:MULTISPECIES: GspH/FimT family pseudopilin [unclassified Marinovum]
MPTSRTETTAHSDTGFTLVELLVVLTVIGLVTAGATRLLFQSDPGFVLRAAVSEVQTTLGQVRSRALLTNRAASVLFDIAEARYRADGADWTDLPEGTALRVIVAGREQLDENRGAIKFYPDGASTGGTVHVSDAIEERGVTVDWLTGRITPLDDDAT